MSGSTKQICLGNLWRDGQSQQQRLLPALDPGSAPIDERDLQQWLDFSTEFARLLNFINPQSNKVDGNWSAFFDQLPADLARQLAFDIDLNDVEQSFAARGDLSPHLGLLISFLRLCRYAREELNGITGRHLDHFYRQVLQLKSAPPVADKVHLLFELKKKVDELLLPKGTLVTAGKDATKKDVQFELADDLSVFPVTIDSLRSVFVDDGLIRLAPLAASSDGIGGEFAEQPGQWPPFGSSVLPQAQIGFAFAAPVLAMAEGTRTITLEMTLNGLPSGINIDSAGEGAFQVYLSGEKGWIGPKSASLTEVSGLYQVTVSLSAEDDAVVAYDAELHGHSFDTGAPLLQLLLNQQKTGFGYHELSAVSITSAEIRVTVEGVTSLQLESDFGKLDPAKPFLPFGPQGKQGASFYVGSAEAFNKTLETFTLKLKWLNAPVSFASHYNAPEYNYSVGGNSFFQAKLRSKINGQEKVSTVNLFDSGNARAEHSISEPPSGSLPVSVLPRPPLMQAQAVSLQQTRWALQQVQGLQLVSPIHWFYPALSVHQGSTPRLRDGFIALRLTRSFLHQEYTEAYTSAVIVAAGAPPVLPNEPYTPTIESLSLNYTASSGKLDLTANSAAAVVDDSLAFFQIAPFGQRRDHSYLRNQLSFLAAKSVPLLPEYPFEGEFYLGFSGVDPGRNLSVLFQVVEGSGEPDLVKPDVQWSVLSDNHWRELSSEELLSDGTNGLLTSGVIRFKLPELATNRNTLLPSGSFWLRATVAQNTAAICTLIDVQPNAVLATFKDQGNDPERLRLPLAAKSISKLVVPQAGIKSVSQPYASFAGRMAEDDAAFRVRVSERLRHKQRAISPWDVERLVLQQFPEIYKAKCLTHTAPDSCEAPGHLTLLVVPSLHNRNAVDPLRPRADLDTLDRIKAYIEGLTGPTATVHAANPLYQSIKVSFHVQFQQQLDFGFYRKLLNEEIIRFLSPWAFSADSDVNFGGRLHKTVILHHIEQLDYVDYLTEFKLYQGNNLTDDLGEARATDPRAILVSVAQHDIQKL
ncbi:Baseplate J-like protein [Malonomonas rubra DSM 5091]|uniref:Baseplate J-like protein n=1 Tax=Malonomonas rubra DSM 5091 TaxID=1122189 RepID=A0A1M6M022_MALRU|nr:baseplate J/gp47 family protein [Malonomonas rubra]SHJ76842.1 Baseplate J-like protein [Malonomonas rubra DSM 5091]